MVEWGKCGPIYKNDSRTHKTIEQTGTKTVSRGWALYDTTGSEVRVIALISQIKWAKCTPIQKSPTKDMDKSLKAVLSDRTFQRKQSRFWSFTDWQRRSRTLRQLDRRDAAVESEISCAKELGEQRWRERQLANFHLRSCRAECLPINRTNKQSFYSNVFVKFPPPPNPFTQIVFGVGGCSRTQLPRGRDGRRW